MRPVWRKREHRNAWCSAGQTGKHTDVHPKRHLLPSTSQPEFPPEEAFLGECQLNGWGGRWETGAGNMEGKARGWEKRQKVGKLNIFKTYFSYFKIYPGMIQGLSRI